MKDLRSPRERARQANRLERLEAIYDDDELQAIARGVNPEEPPRWEP